MAHVIPPSQEAVMRKLAIVAALAGLVTAVVRKQRERELDEAIWEEPYDV